MTPPPAAHPRATLWTLLAGNFIIGTGVLLPAGLHNAISASLAITPATTGLLVPAQKRAGAIAFIFIGWSAASVAGIPLGSYFAALTNWRAVFAGMGIACALAAILVWVTLPRGLFVQPLTPAAWKQAFTTPALLVVLLVTLFSMSGQMTVFSYIAPLMRDVFAAGPEQVAIAFAVSGIAGVIGNAIAARTVARLGIDRVIAITVGLLIAGLAIFAASFGHYLVALVGVALWGLGSFSSNSLQQSRLVAIAPSLAAATVALNTSIVYVGQAVGAGLGGWFVSKAITPSIAWTACALTVAALLASILATRMTKR